MSNINGLDFESTTFSEDAKLTRNRKNIIELFESYNDEYTSVEVDWGDSVGKEKCYFLASHTAK